MKNLTGLINLDGIDRMCNDMRLKSEADGYLVFPRRQVFAIKRSIGDTIHVFQVSSQKKRLAKS